MVDRLGVERFDDADVIGYLSCVGEKVTKHRARLAMLLAVLQRHGNLSMAGQDVFVNIVGGVRIAETAADLPILAAVMSSLRDRAIAASTVAFGEVGLAGEIRPVPYGEERIIAAAKHGFKRAIVPFANSPKKPVKGIEVVGVKRLAGAIDALS